MVQLIQKPIWTEELELNGTLSELTAAGKGLPWDHLAMPRVYRKPAQPACLRRNRLPLERLLREAKAARELGHTADFGQVYGQLTIEFQPLLHWTLSCWDHLLTVQGCRFLPRPPHEKLYCRGDYRVFIEKDFQRLVFASFKEFLQEYLDQPAGAQLTTHLQDRFWPKVSSAYKALEDPSDPRQRKLTGYSYLRCVPYQFLNSLHHERVYRTVNRLPEPLRQVIELYHLRFFRDAAAEEKLSIRWHAFRRRLSLALRTVEERDYLSFILLKQIERY